MFHCCLKMNLHAINIPQNCDRRTKCCINRFLDLDVNDLFICVNPILIKFLVHS